MSRKVGQIIARGERHWLVRAYLGGDRETRKRTYHNRTICGSLRHAHASAAFTLDTYSHVLPHMQAEAASKMEAVLLNGPSL